MENSEESQESQESLRIPMEALRIVLSGRVSVDIPARMILKDGFMFDPSTREVSLVLQADMVQVMPKKPVSGNPTGPEDP